MDTAHSTTLTAIDAFQNLDLAEREDVARRCRLLRFRPGQQIVALQERSRDVFFIVSGQARAMMTRLTAADGHQLDCWIEPAKGERRGGLVIIQEIFGVTDQLKGVAARYAALGHEVAIPALFDRKERGAVIPFDQTVNMTYTNTISMPLGEEVAVSIEDPSTSPTAFSTPRAPPESLWVTIPSSCISASARREASNSIGSVTSWNSTAAPKSTMPTWARPPSPSIRPKIARYGPKLPPIWATGSRAPRHCRGA